MCNKLHDDSQPIPEEGLGWKIVIQGNGELRAPVNRTLYSRGIIVWEDGEGGFCFFLKRSEALRASRAYDWVDHRSGNFYDKQRVVKIRYWRGLGKHIETKFVTKFNVEIALCKEFEFVNKRLYKRGVRKSE
jgi:hypothetical protein